MLDFIPEGEGEFAHQFSGGVVTPFQERLEEQVGVGADSRTISGQPECVGKLLPIVEPNIGDKLEGAAAQRLPVKLIFWKNGVQEPPGRKRRLAANGGFRTVCLLTLEDSRAVITGPLITERPKSCNRAQNALLTLVVERRGSKNPSEIYDLFEAPSFSLPVNFSAEPASICFTSGLRHTFLAITKLLNLLSVHTNFRLSALAPRLKRTARVRSVGRCASGREAPTDPGRTPLPTHHTRPRADFSARQS